MTRVHITQCLCPDRHCIIAIVWKEPDHTKDSAEAHLKSLMDEMTNLGVLNPWCGICNSRDLHCEDGITKFQSIKEAMPFLKELEAQQIRSMIALTAQRN